MERNRETALVERGASLFFHSFHLSATANPAHCHNPTMAASLALAAGTVRLLMAAIFLLMAPQAQASGAGVLQEYVGNYSLVWKPMRNVCIVYYEVKAQATLQRRLARSSPQCFCNTYGRV